MRFGASVTLAITMPCTALTAQEAAKCDGELATLVQTVQDLTTRVPLTSATVSARWSTSTTSARTDSTGKARICAPAGVAVIVKVSYRNISSNEQAMVLDRARAAQHTLFVDAPNSLLRGRVTDHVTGQPVFHADVYLAHTSIKAVTDEQGGFVFPRVPVGDYTLRVAHISYANVASQVRVRADDLSADVQLLPDALPLNPVTVTAFSVRLERAGFYERQKRGVGTFLSRQHIDRMSVLRSSDLLRGTPGTRLVPQTSRRNAPPNATIGRGSCRYKIIVDGTRTLPDFEIDNVAPYALEGVEIYRGLAEVPAEFRAITEVGAGACGVVALWTRDRP